MMKHGKEKSRKSVGFEAKSNQQNVVASTKSIVVNEKRVKKSDG